ncbi:MAG: methionyl-tRNA formyltransferase [Lactobacillales bacterium]|jgi:methionyl-tRNA formyltransferase|nr:methionyl-tRNA formyltransferase [Lactobacillales bacterium]
MIRVVFMGTPAFSVPILEGLIEQDYQILAVVTQPNRKVGRKGVLTPPPVKVVAQKYNLLTLQPEKIASPAEVDKILDLNPDLIVTAAFGQFLPEKLFKTPKFGAINVHASLLPKYRGGAPVHYAIINGESKTGITIMMMAKKMDAGDIIAQKTLSITKKDNVGTMFEKLSLLGRDLLLETLPAYLEGKIKLLPQNEDAATFSPNITCTQEQINWQKEAMAINNQIRGMYPWPIAYTIYKDLRIKIHQATVIKTETTMQKPGTVVKRTKKELWIAAGKGTILQLDKVQPAGKSKLKIVDFLNGVGKILQVGDVFSNLNVEA